MRTTVDLPDPLLRAARKQAAGSGATLSAVVTDALRAYLGRPTSAEPPFEVVTYGKAGNPAPTPAEIAEALDADEEASLDIAREAPSSC